MPTPSREPCPRDTLAETDLRPALARVALDHAPAGIAARCRSVAEVMERLAAAGFLVEAATIVAHSLPRREAVWWACVCADITAPANLSARDRRAAAAARSWVCRPHGEAGRAALEQAESAGLATPEAWAAMAAFWSDETSPEDDTPRYLTGVAVAGAIGLAATRIMPGRREAVLRQFLASARQITFEADCLAAA